MPSHEENAAALDWIADLQNVRLNARLKSIYGIRLQHELTLARLRLLVFLGKYSEADSECVSMIKAIRSGDACGTKPKQIIKEDEGKTGRTNKTSATDATNAGDVENEDEEEVVAEKWPRRYIQLEVYLICEILSIRAKIYEYTSIWQMYSHG